MRWEALFADLEGQLAAQEVDPAYVADLVRAEVAGVQLVDRLRAAVGTSVQVRLVAGGPAVGGAVLDVGADWLLIHDGAAQVLVPTAAIAAVGGLARAVAAPAGAVQRRLTLRVALRALARQRVPVAVETPGHRLYGTIDRVAADHVDLAEHPPGEARRARAVSGTLAVPLTAVMAVRSSDVAPHG